MATSESWNDPERCPFCGDPAGFIVHLGENAGCEEAFETWRDRISDDIVGGWTG